MPIDIANKPQLTGIIILFTGVALLAFTFINAFLFLQEPLGIIATSDLARVFGEALGPLIQACIRLMYLGIMGWIGSLLTIRGIPLITHKPLPVAAPTVPAQAKPQLQPRPIKQPKPTPQLKPTAQPPSEPQPKPAPQPQQQPTPTTQPQPALQQVKPRPQPQPQAPQEQTTQPTPEPKQEEPKVILIPPENQREE